MTIEIFDSNAPIRQAFGHFVLTPQGDATDISFRLEYAMKFGPLGALLNALIVRRLFTKGNVTVLTGLMASQSKQPMSWNRTCSICIPMVSSGISCSPIRSNSFPLTRKLSLRRSHG